jgi:hypothetical protein
VVAAQLHFTNPALFPIRRELDYQALVKDLIAVRKRLSGKTRTA